nr:MAG TPA: Mitochondrial ribosomal protein L12, Mitochondrial initiation, initiation factor IF2 [Caudoviricetes sp.]
MPIVVESIQENGFNTANNDFLTYLLNTNDVVNSLDMKNIALI